MKKRFLPISLLLVIMVLGQSLAIADQGGHYVPRTQGTDAESFMGSLRANQHTGLIDPADMFKAMQTPSMRNAADDPLYWISMGPDNMGGLTTAVLYDNTMNSHNMPNGVVYIGSMGGGVYKSYNNGITWHQVGNQNLMVSCMAQDANGIIYVGTGDGNNSATYNGLSQQNYDNSFVGTGIYTIDARHNDAMVQVVAPSEGEWLYINDLAVAGNTILAATTEGLRYSIDKGQNWEMVIEGNALEVKVGSDNTIVASIDGQIYIGSNVSNLTCHSAAGGAMQGDTLLPTAAGLLDVAIAPSNANVIYAACVGTDGKHTGVYVSENKGVNWRVALPSVSPNTGHDLYGGYGLFNHGLVVDPTNEGLVYVLSYTMSSLQKPSEGTGYYIAQMITSNTIIADPAYLHVGLHTMVFNPNNANECYVGTDGGVYKGTGRFTFANCNRNYVTSRMFNVAYSGKDTRILAAGLDHGTVKIEGEENTNHASTGLWINPTGANLGAFTDASHAGPCAISMINQNTFFVTYKGGGLERTETAGEDWVSTNFTSSSSMTISTSSYRMPILLHEDYDDELSPNTVWFYNTDTLPIPGGTHVQCISNNNYPFDFQLPATLAVGDSIEVHDPINAKLFVTFTDALYMTLTPLNFGLETQWYKVADKAHTGFIGEPLSIAKTADGNHIFVGMKNGRFYRVSNINTVIDDATGSITDSLFQVTTTEIVLPVSGQCVTSIAVDPRNANKVIVTCGNYGNEDYVFYSANALDEEPVFTTKQGNLPKMPVYASLIEMATGDVILGTERGIYRTKNIANAQWTADNQVMGEVPVMELKQQLLYREDAQVISETEEGIFVTDYPGVYNTGVIYAATYGRGVFRCENYKKEFASVPETPAVEETMASVVMYPNPVRGEATVSFEMNDNANVSYQVFDLTGRMVMNQNVGRYAEGTHEIRINTENLSTGSYILRLNQGNNVSCVKFLVY